MSAFSSHPPVTVAYWAIRGLAAPLRQMVMYAGVPLNNVMYEITGEAGSFSADEWFSVKPSLKEQHPLINLPYVVDGEVVVTQTNACMAYLGRKFGMWGDTAQEQIQCECMDLRNRMISFAYGRDKTTHTAAISEAQGKNSQLQKLELWLEKRVKDGGSGGFLVGEKATAPDFALFEMLVQYTALAEFCSAGPLLGNYPRLSHFFKTFAELPGNARYLGHKVGSSKPLYVPFNNKSALFGGSCELTPWGAESRNDLDDVKNCVL
ncbi:hypothetical protein B484DRAFT_427372 [Ochromonadaceae sp. CCMP2298]|nr:hypothetical protein B484DRAFT_427372 [Ochromonadaceae sp. CCMP2298]